MPHNVSTLLEDIRYAAELLDQFTASQTLDAYRTDPLLRAAVERQFIVAGEALSRLEKLAPSVAIQITDHRKIIDFRNVLVHGYDVIDDQIVWNAVELHLPVLKHEVERLLRDCAPAESPQ